MKTRMNVRQIAPMSLVSAAMIFVASLMPANANAAKSAMMNEDIAAATYRLDNLNGEIEASLRFVAPEVSANDEIAYFETEAAVARLEVLNNNLEKSAKFEAPSVDVKSEAAEYEVGQAYSRLDKLNVNIKESIRYQAPAAE